jgi:hypothetical protein
MDAAEWSTVLKINLKLLGRVPIPKGVFIPLEKSYLCSDCEAIGNDSRKCCCCSSTSIFAMSRFIPQHQDTLRLHTPESPANRAVVRFMRPAMPLAIVAGKK